MEDVATKVHGMVEDAMNKWAVAANTGDDAEEIRVLVGGLGYAVRWLLKQYAEEHRVTAEKKGDV